MSSAKSPSEHVHYLPIHALFHSDKEVFRREKQPNGAADLTLYKSSLLLHNIIST